MISRRMVGFAFTVVLTLWLLCGSSNAMDHGNGKGRTQIQFFSSLDDPSISRLFAKIDVVTTNGNTGKTKIRAHGNGNGHGNNKGHGNNGNNGKGNGGKGNSGGNGAASGDDDNNQSNGNNQGDDDNQGNNNSGNNQDDDGNDGGSTTGNPGGGSFNHSLAGDTLTLTIGSASFSGVADSNGQVSTPFNAKLVANGRTLMIDASGLNLVELFPLDKTDGVHQVSVAITVTATTAASTGKPSVTSTLSSQNVNFIYVVRHGFAKGRNF